MSGSTITTEARVGNVPIQQSAQGAVVPLIYGKNRVGVNLIWYGNFESVEKRESQGGKGGVDMISYSYYAALIAAVGQGPLSINRVWRAKQKYSAAEIGDKLNIEWLSGSHNSVWTWLHNHHGGQHVHVGSGLGYAITSVASTGSAVSLGFATQDAPPFEVGSQIVVGGMDPAGYNGTYTVLACTTGSVTYASTADVTVNSFGSVAAISKTISNEDINYYRTAYLASARYALDQGAQIPNHTVEVTNISTGPTPLPMTIIGDLLVRCGLPYDAYGSFVAANQYATAMGITCSPAITTAAPTADLIEQLAVINNVGIVPSEGKLKFVPYAAQAVGDFVPNTTPAYDLTDDDFVAPSGDPIIVTRKSDADTFNHVQCEYADALLDYNTSLAEAKDDASIGYSSPRTKEKITLLGVTDAGVARMVAQQILQREIAVRNEYDFTLTPRHMLLEPMDFVTITDSLMGFDELVVRVTEVVEQDDGTLKVRAEDAPLAAFNPARYAFQSNAGYVADYSIAPGSVAAPVFFEPPIELTTATGLEVWCAVSGQSANWGGCDVWVSMDGTNYVFDQTIERGSRYGTLTSALASGASAGLSVALSGLGGQLLSGSAADAAALQTLCWVGDATGGEFLAYETATLTSANAYTLSGLLRGAYGTAASAKSGGMDFVRVDSSIAKSAPLDLSMIGKTIYFKFCSYNIYGAAKQGLADIQPYTHVVTGSMVNLPPANVAGLSLAVEGIGVRAQWTACPNVDYAHTELRVGSNWANATPVASIAASSHLLDWQAAGTATVWAVHVDRLGNASPNPASATLAISPPGAPSALQLGFGPPGVTATWAAPGVSLNQQPIARAELSWSSDFGTVINGHQATSSHFGWLPSGAYTLYVRYVDVAGNTGASVQATLQVLPPAQPVMTAVDTQVNLVTLRWQDAKTSQPIKKYAIYYGNAGTPLASSLLYGSAGGDSRSDILQYRSAGNKVAYLVAEDQAGNVGQARQIDLTIQMPDSYVLSTEYYEDWQPAELTNATIVGGATGQIMLPVDTGRAWGERLSNDGWTTAQQKVDAGYPLVMQPVPTFAKHVERHDCGRAVSGEVHVTPTVASSLPGAVAAIRIRASVGASTNSWQAWADGGAASFLNFQYIEVEYSVSSDGHGFVVLDDLHVAIQHTVSTESATLTLSPTDPEGTPYICTRPFISVRSVQITPLGSSAIARPPYYVVDDIAQPPKIYVFAHDTNNTRTGGVVSLSITGVIANE